MARSVVGFTACVGLALGAMAGACSSSSSGGGSTDGGGPHDSSMPGDSSMGNDTGGGDAAGPTDGGGSTDTTSGSDADAGTPPGDAATDAPVLTAAATVALPGTPKQLAFDTTTNWLYVLLASGQQGQITAIDTTSNTVKWTLTQSVGTGNFGFNVLAVDSTANVVYAGADTAIYAYDGTSNALKATIDVSGVTTAHYVWGLAVDEAAQKLYALLGYANGPQTVAVIDTSTATPTVGPIIALADLLQDFDPSVNGLALDTQNHLLFACGLSSGTGSPPAADAIDTTTNTEKGAPQVFAGASVGCKAIPGSAAMVTGPSGGTSAQLHMLEPASVNLPPNFQPTSFESLTDALAGENGILVHGVNGTTGSPVWASYWFCGESSVPGFVTGTEQFLVGASTRGTSLSSAQDIWFTEVSQVDGGVASSFVYKLHIDKTFLPPPLDGGCDGG